MKAVLEAEHRLPAGEESRHLDGVLHRLRPAVHEEGPLFVGAGSEPVEPLGELHVRLVGRDGEADVRVPVELSPYRLDDAWVPVAGVHHADAAAEIDQPVAVGVGEHGALGVHHGDGRHRRHTARHRLGAARHQGAAVGAGDLGLQVDDAGHDGLGGAQGIQARVHASS
jgi:hypothetical protein